jgi:hypothetical protein
MRIAAYGWDHAGWAGGYYPADLPEEWRLAYYANAFPAVPAWWLGAVEEAAALGLRPGSAGANRRLIWRHRSSGRCCGVRRRAGVPGRLRGLAELMG